MTGGAVPSPFECWLTLRGIRTLPIRVRAQTRERARARDFLANHPWVEAVHYPGLASHPAHDIARKQMSEFGGMLSVQAGSDRAAVARDRGPPAPVHAGDEPGRHGEPGRAPRIGRRTGDARAARTCFACPWGSSTSKI